MTYPSDPWTASLTSTISIPSWCALRYQSGKSLCSWIYQLTLALESLCKLKLSSLLSGRCMMWPFYAQVTVVSDIASIGCSNVSQGLGWLTHRKICDVPHLDGISLHSLQFRFEGYTYLPKHPAGTGGISQFLLQLFWHALQLFTLHVAAAEVAKIARTKVWRSFMIVYLDVDKNED